MITVLNIMLIAGSLGFAGFVIENFRDTNPDYPNLMNFITKYVLGPRSRKVLWKADISNPNREYYVKIPHDRCAVKLYAIAEDGAADKVVAIAIISERVRHTEMTHTIYRLIADYDRKARKNKAKKRNENLVKSIYGKGE